MTCMRPAHAAAQFISLRAIGSDARFAHRPAGPGGAGLVVTRSASFSAVSPVTGPFLSRANGSLAAVASVTVGARPLGCEVWAASCRAQSAVAMALLRNPL